MTTILIAVLFFLQLLSFYFLIILNTKLAKFKELEKKQERLMREMDDTISMYLTEMKDENDRFIQELQNVSQPALASTSIQHTAPVMEQKHSSLSTVQQKKEDSSTTLEADTRVYVPKNIVANAYSRQQQASANNSPVVPTTTANHEQKKEQTLTLEQQVLELMKQGKTSEEIAKQLQKGKTEIELLLKFQH
ncbi:hypothetical protein MHB44_05870 [Lysinibacillus sp. FSL H8-0500]|uniref:DUF6115 domain-containing protein n=1 Tax=Lysinibacillus sp. FSL H8-0500 TaxID=2921393 RepID=UPI003101020C